MEVPALADIEVSTQTDIKAFVQALHRGGFPRRPNEPSLLTGYVDHVGI